MNSGEIKRVVSCLHDYVVYKFVLRETAWEFVYDTCLGGRFSRMNLQRVFGLPACARRPQLAGTWFLNFVFSNDEKIIIMNRGEISRTHSTVPGRIGTGTMINLSLVESQVLFVPHYNTSIHKTHSERQRF